MIDLEGLRERWLREKPLYEDFARYVKIALDEAARRRGLVCTSTHRSKGVSELLKKALRKRYADPYDEIRDKAGVRLVATYPDSIQYVEDIVGGLFSIVAYENKIVGLEYDKLGYLGVHFEVQLREESVTGELARYRGLICEVQLHTRAQNLWAEVAHEIAYKPPQEPPLQVKRSVYLLASLVEIFDQQLGRARKEILEMPTFFEARMLSELERHYFRFTARQYDRELSLNLIGKLRDLLDEDEARGFEGLLSSFVERREAKLEEIFRDYADDSRSNPLLFQPECLLIFERLEKDPFRLKETWSRTLPLSLLESLGAVWGVAV